MTGSVSYGTSMTLSATAGVELADGEWHPIADYGHHYDPPSLDWRLEGGGDISVRVEPRVVFRFYGQAGPYVGLARGLGLRGSIPLVDHDRVNVEIYSTLSGFVGGEVKVLTKRLLTLSYELFQLQFTIYQDTFCLAGDRDDDDVCDPTDNCPDDSNHDQSDSDADGAGDACDPPPPPPVCTSNGQCNDGNPCTIDTCNGGLCANTPDCVSANQCEDDEPCTTDACSNGCCVNTLTSPCCGNRTCESRESCSSCSEDCGACPTGACCVNGTTCNTNMTQASCIGQGGVWQGANTAACQNCPPTVTGACCVNGTTCNTNVSEASCTSQGGVWQGANTTTCQNCPPPPTDPIPVLMSVDGIPSSSTPIGQPFTVAVRARNDGGTSPEGAINASVLYDDGSSDSDDVGVTNPSGNGFNELIRRTPGQTIRNNRCEPIVAYNHMVEAVDSAWEQNESKAMNFTVTPNRAGVLWVRVRSTMAADVAACDYINHQPFPGGVADTDQQGWSVRRYAVMVVSGNRAPEASRSSPTTSSITVETGTTVTFAVNGTDADCNLDGAEWYLDGQPQDSYFDLSGCNGTSRWSHRFDVGRSNYQVEGVVFDTVSAYSTPVEWFVTVTEAPVIILSEGFEGSFPGDWIVTDSNSAGAEAYWSDVGSSFGGEGVHSGSWKGYCAGVGYGGSSTTPTYQNSMQGQMIAELDLRSYQNVTLEFWYKIPSIESCCDKAEVLMTSSGGTDLVAIVYATTWTRKTIDLSRHAGSGYALLSFMFTSDSTAVREGWYLDDIRLTGRR